MKSIQSLQYSPVVHSKLAQNSSTCMRMWVFFLFSALSETACKACQHSSACVLFARVAVTECGISTADNTYRLEMRASIKGYNMP